MVLKNRYLSEYPLKSLSCMVAFLRRVATDVGGVDEDVLAVGVHNKAVAFVVIEEFAGSDVSHLEGCVCFSCLVKIRKCRKLLKRSLLEYTRMSSANETLEFEQ